MADDSDGKGSTDWKVSLPEAVQAWDETKNSDTSEKFWSQMTNMRSHLGQSIRVPGGDAGAEDWTTFNQKLISKVPTLMLKPDASDEARMAEVYKAMGKPEEVGKYTSPEGLKHVVGDALTKLQEQAHGMHLNNAQFATLAKEVESKLSERETAGTEQVESEVATLKSEWGVAFDKHYGSITKYLEDSGAPKELQDSAKTKTLSPASAKWVLSQFEATKGEGSHAANDSSTGDVVTPSEALLQISEIMNNKDHAYWKPRDPANRVALDRMVKLHKLAKGVT